jgi:hypothetical protein
MSWISPSLVVKFSHTITVIFCRLSKSKRLVSLNWNQRTYVPASYSTTFSNLPSEKLNSCLHFSYGVEN